VGGTGPRRLKEVCPLLRRALLSVSRSDRIRHLVETAPVSRRVVARFVAGTTADDAVAASRALLASGRLVSLDRLGEDTVDREQADRTRDAYLLLLRQLAEHGLTAGAEVSLKLSAVGQALPRDGEKLARDNAFAVCHAARDAGTTVTLDMEGHTTVDSTLGILRELRADVPATGAVLQSYLRRTEADCRDLAGAGSRVRLCKGAYKAPESVAFQGKAQVDRSYVRCLKVLVAGDGYPMVATHDPRLLAVFAELARRHGRAQDSYEYQMLYGIRPHEQVRLAAAGERVRVYVPYGDEWYGYLVRRMAERPANLGFFLRSVATKG
jgi:proline dehydrogenase